ASAGSAALRAVRAALERKRTTTWPGTYCRFEPFSVRVTPSRAVPAPPADAATAAASSTAARAPQTLPLPMLPLSGLRPNPEVVIGRLLVHFTPVVLPPPACSR